MPVPLLEAKLSKLLRNDSAASVDELGATHHQFTAKVVVLTDVFEEFLSRLQGQGVGVSGPGRRVSAGVIDRQFIPHLSGRGPGELFDLSLIHISEPTRLLSISYAVFC